jgi:hypothetical protein
MIALEGAVNFRDLGGYEASAGRRTRWRTLFRADGLGELTETDLSVLRGFDIRTVIDLRSGSELERGQFDVEAHPVAFHHFPFIDELPDAQDFDRRPGLLGTQYLEIVRDAGGQIPLHGRQGSHRSALRHCAVAARRGRADRGGRLRAEWRRHAATAGQAH